MDQKVKNIGNYWLLRSQFDKIWDYKKALGNSENEKFEEVFEIVSDILKLIGGGSVIIHHADYPLFESWANSNMIMISNGGDKNKVTIAKMGKTLAVIKIINKSI